MLDTRPSGADAAQAAGAPATSSSRFCPVCGWFTAGKACNACGAEPGHTTATQDHQAVSLFAGPRPEDFPHLRSAFAAWRNKDWTRMVGQCLECLGVERQTVVRREQGPGWTFVQDSAAIYLRIDEEAEELSVEAPMVWMPRTQRVPLMRALLELNGSALGIARFCVREDRVVLRFADTLNNLNPPKLVQAIAKLTAFLDEREVGAELRMLMARSEKLRQMLSTIYEAEAAPHGLQGMMV